jgi:hypothetical protein
MGDDRARPQGSRVAAPQFDPVPFEDGRVIERLCPQPIRKAAAPAAGQKVLVLYDPADPTDVLVNGWDGRYGNLAFLAAGMFFIVFGIGMALGH